MRFSPLIPCVLAMAALSDARGDELLRGRVNDRAGVMRTDAKQPLESMLAELEDKTGAQLVVLIISTTAGRDIYEYGREVFMSAGRTRRGLGQKGEDNGALVLIAVQDRKYHIFVGEGIEDELPDLYCHKVAEQYFVPHFRAGDYSKGVLEGVTVLAQKLAAGNNVTLVGAPKVSPPQGRGVRRTRGTTACMSAAVMIFVLLVLLAGRGRGHRRRRTGFWEGMMLASVLSNMGRSSRGSFGGWSAGGGGGWGGGFGGGGGGSFGGGGAGGSW